MPALSFNAPCSRSEACHGQILALAESFWAADARKEAAPDDLPEAAYDDLFRKWADAAEACYLDPPVTLKGAEVLAAVLLRRDEHNLDRDTLAGLRCLHASLKQLLA